MDDELKQLLKENLAATEEVKEMVKGIKRYVIFQRVWGWFKILFILVPIVLSIIYLPPLLKDAVSQYQSLLGLDETSSQLEQLLHGGNIDADDLDEYLK